MQELESSLHLIMTFQPFAPLATSKKDAISMMIYTNNQIPKFTGFFFSLSCVAFDVAAFLCRCNNSLGQKKKKWYESTAL